LWFINALTILYIKLANYFFELNDWKQYLGVKKPLAAHAKRKINLRQLKIIHNFEHEN